VVDQVLSVLYPISEVRGQFGTVRGFWEVQNLRAAPAAAALGIFNVSGFQPEGLVSKYQQRELFLTASLAREITSLHIVLRLNSCIGGTMIYSQSALPLHHYEDLGFSVPSYASLHSSFHINQSFQASYTVAQIALLLTPSAVLLLLFPVRVFQLRRASLKVLPNYTGAIKAVGCARTRVTQRRC
jgi:hypothetical protein